MEFNKLVRDKIPQIIKSHGQNPQTRTLDDVEYITCLEAKLDEEVQEYHQDKTIEELADILEVVYALAEGNGHSKEELMTVYQKKHDLRGGFQDRVFLISRNDG